MKKKYKVKNVHAGFFIIIKNDERINAGWLSPVFLILFLNNRKYSFFLLYRQEICLLRMSCRHDSFFPLMIVLIKISGEGEIQSAGILLI